MRRVAPPLQNRFSLLFAPDGPSFGESLRKRASKHTVRRWSAFVPDRLAYKLLVWLHPFFQEGVLWDVLMDTCAHSTLKTSVWRTDFHMPAVDSESFVQSVVATGSRNHGEDKKEVLLFNYLNKYYNQIVYL